VAEGAAWLAAQEPRFARALELTGPLPLRLAPDGFAALFNKIVSQQVSVASARAIWGRVEAAGLVTPDAVRAAGE
jgi:DNA-3-methyladenine glycosylase II